MALTPMQNFILRFGRILLRAESRFIAFTEFMAETSDDPKKQRRAFIYGCMFSLFLFFSIFILPQLIELLIFGEVEQYVR